MTIPTDTQLREFLLRRMPSEDATRLEEAIIVEEGVAERLRTEEFDLIDDYAAGRLIAEDRADVERHLLTSAENVHSLRMARLMARESSVRDATPPVRSGTQAEVLRLHRRMRHLAPVGGLLAAGLAAVILIPHWGGVLRQPVGIPSTAAGSAAPLPGPSQLPGVAADSPPILTLLADVDRGSTRPSLHWRADLASVRLQAEVPGPERGTLYSLSVYDMAGHRVFEGTALSAHAAGRYRFVDTVLPSTALGPGARTISLRASDAVAGAPAEYTWQVVGVLD